MMSVRRRWFISGVAIASLASPAAALADGGHRHLRLIGRSTGTVSVDISTVPSPTTFSSSGHLSHIGAFTATGDESFTPLGLPPEIPFSLAGTETITAANGDEIFGAVNGTGTNNAGATSGTNVVTITGGTGRFANACGSFTETYTGSVTSQVGAIVSGPVTTEIRGWLSYKAR